MKLDYLIVGCVYLVTLATVDVTARYIPRQNPRPFSYNSPSLQRFGRPQFQPFSGPYPYPILSTFSLDQEYGRHTPPIPTRRQPPMTHYPASSFYNNQNRFDSATFENYPLGSPYRRGLQVNIRLHHKPDSKFGSTNHRHVSIHTSYGSDVNGYPKRHGLGVANNHGEIHEISVRLGKIDKRQPFKNDKYVQHNGHLNRNVPDVKSQQVLSGSDAIAVNSDKHAQPKLIDGAHAVSDFIKTVDASVNDPKATVAEFQAKQPQSKFDVASSNQPSIEPIIPPPTELSKVFSSKSSQVLGSKSTIRSTASGFKDPKSAPTSTSITLQFNGVASTDVANRAQNKAADVGVAGVAKTSQIADSNGIANNNNVGVKSEEADTPDAPDGNDVTDAPDVPETALLD